MLVNSGVYLSELAEGGRLDLVFFFSSCWFCSYDSQRGRCDSSDQILRQKHWAVLSDEQMSNGYPFSLLNDEQMSNKVGVKHQPEKEMNARRSQELG